MRSLTDFAARLAGIMPIKRRRLVLEGDLLWLKTDIRPRISSCPMPVIEVGPDTAATILVARKARHAASIA